MKLFPDYREFYQSALLPMGMKDKTSYVSHSDISELEEISLSHWLIALQGYPESPSSDFYHWQVLVFPSNVDGSFNFKSPYFKSDLFSCIHKAFQFAGDLKLLAKTDNLTTNPPLEKIS